MTKLIKFWKISIILNWTGFYCFFNQNLLPLYKKKIIIKNLWEVVLSLRFLTMQILRDSFFCFQLNFMGIINFLEKSIPNFLKLKVDLKKIWILMKNYQKFSFFIDQKDVKKLCIVLTWQQNVNDLDKIFSYNYKKSQRKSGFRMAV